MAELIVTNAQSEDEVYFWMNGGCGTFAYALWIANGKPNDADFYIISNVDGEPWFGNEDDDEPTHDFEATHVYYQGNDNLTIDAKGIRSVESMIDDFGIHANIEGAWSPENFKNEWMGDDDRKPLFYDDTILEEALALIKKYSVFYGLTS